MTEPFIGEIMMFAGNYPPMGWAFCNGQILQISQNDVLFSLIGNQYGGDGQTTFALPDLQGRIPIHRSSEYPMAAKGGTEQVQLAPDHLPSHTHRVLAQNASGDQASPAGGVWAGSTVNQYTQGAPNGAMAPTAVTSAGGSQTHDNMMPFLTISYCIALQGIYPTQN